MELSPASPSVSISILVCHLKGQGYSSMQECCVAQVYNPRSIVMPCMYVPVFSFCENVLYSKMRIYESLTTAPLGTECSSGVRLTDGTNEHEGRVEVCYGGYWSSLCASGWTENNTMVVCRQLGLSAAGKLMYVSGTQKIYSCL